MAVAESWQWQRKVPNTHRIGLTIIGVFVLKDCFAVEWGNLLLLLFKITPALHQREGNRGIPNSCFCELPQVPPEPKNQTGHLLVQILNSHDGIGVSAGVFCKIQGSVSMQGEQEEKAGIYMEMSGLDVQLWFTIYAALIGTSKNLINLLSPKQLVCWLL